MLHNSWWEICVKKKRYPRTEEDEGGMYYCTVDDWFSPKPPRDASPTSTIWNWREEQRWRSRLQRVPVGDMTGRNWSFRRSIRRDKRKFGYQLQQSLGIQRTERFTRWCSTKKKCWAAEKTRQSKKETRNHFANTCSCVTPMCTVCQTWSLQLRQGWIQK